MNLPTCLLIGAPRAGTTAVHHWLDSHPDVCAARPKETHFFSSEYDRGLEHYARYFAHRRDEAAVVESTPTYLALPFVPARIASSLPAVRLVAILREPVQQVYSAWWKIHSMGADRRTFADCVEQELRDGTFDTEASEVCWLETLAATRGGAPIQRSQYLVSGDYAGALARYDDHFSRDQLTVLLHDDLIDDPASVMAALSRVIGVDVARAPSPVPPHVNEGAGALTASAQRLVRRVPSARIRHQVTRVARSLDKRPAPQLDPGLRRTLTDYFHDRNRGLSERIGHDVTHWSQPAMTAS